MIIDGNMIIVGMIVIIDSSSIVVIVIVIIDGSMSIGMIVIMIWSYLISQRPPAPRERSHVRMPDIRSASTTTTTTTKNINDKDINMYDAWEARGEEMSVVRTPSPPTKSLGFEGFDSSSLLILRGGNSYVRRIL